MCFDTILLSINQSLLLTSLTLLLCFFGISIWFFQFKQGGGDTLILSINFAAIITSI